MTNKSIATSPQVYARAGGALYLAIIVLGAFKGVDIDKWKGRMLLEHA
jgi:hypothetical protein